PDRPAGLRDDHHDALHDRAALRRPARPGAARHLRSHGVARLLHRGSGPGGAGPGSRLPAADRVMPMADTTRKEQTGAAPGGRSTVLTLTYLLFGPIVWALHFFA